MAAPLTFAEFQASGRDVSDLRESEHPEFHDREIHPDPCPGRLYAVNATSPGLYLQAPDATVAGWYFEFGMAFLIGTLADCEACLYAVYLDEVIGAEHPDYAALRAAAPRNLYWRA